MTTSIWCPECDAEHEVVVIQGPCEGDDYAEGPSECAECGTSLCGGGLDPNEDFHADG